MAALLRSLCFVGLAALCAAMASPVLADSSAVIHEFAFLERPESPRIHIDVSRPGQPLLEAVVDTGSNSFIAEGLASARGKVDDSGTATLETRLGALEVALGGEFSEARFDSLKRDYFLLGADNLRRFVVEIDFDARKLRLLDPQKAAVPDASDRKDEAVLAIRHVMGRTLLQIPLNGQTGLTVLDTGATTTLALDERSVLAAKMNPRTLERLAPLGITRRPRLWPLDLQFGAIELKDVPVFVSENGYVDEFGNGGNAMGLDLISRFRVRIDYPNSRVLLRKRESAGPTWMGIDYRLTEAAGAFLRPTPGGYVVAGVREQSPGAALGLELGDRLDRDTLGFDGLSEILQRIAKQDLLLVLRRGPTDWEPLMLPSGDS